MNAALLDTSVLIDISKGRVATDRQVTSLMRAGVTLGVCAVNVAEFYAGVSPGEQPEMDSFLGALRCWPLSRVAGMNAGADRRSFRRNGVQLSTTDTLIAASARQHRAVVLTGNVRHFPMEDVGVLPSPPPSS